MTVSDIVDDLLFLAGDDPRKALEIAAREIYLLGRSTSAGYVRAKPEKPMPVVSPDPVVSEL